MSMILHHEKKGKGAYSSHESFPKRPFDAIAFDWDGTAVVDRRHDARVLSTTLTSLCNAGVDVAIVTGTHEENIVQQLQPRCEGPGSLYLCVNRGSEVYAVEGTTTRLVFRRTATAAEDASLDEITQQVLLDLRARGLAIPDAIHRLNRRKIDLLPQWGDPPKDQIDTLLSTVQDHLKTSQLSLKAVVNLVARRAAEHNMANLRITTDAKHVELGLTDKGDAASWLMRYWWSCGLGPSLIAIIGDEMGTLGGVPGSDSRMLTRTHDRISVFTVGVEPERLPKEVINVGGGPEQFLQFLKEQLELHLEQHLPRIDIDPAWSISLDGAGHRLERHRQTLLTLASGSLGSGGAPCLQHPTVTPSVLIAGTYIGEGPASELQPQPAWQHIEALLPHNAHVQRTLDMHTGVLYQDIINAHGHIEALSFAPLDHPLTGVLAVEDFGLGLVHSHPASATITPDPDVQVIKVPVKENIWSLSQSTRMDRVTSYETTKSTRSKDLDHATASDLLKTHRIAWAKRWEDADIIITGDDVMQQRLRFALFHLMSEVGDIGESAVGARGVSGSAYHGHVFWDTDVFVLPFLAATHPAAARALLQYRVRTLPQAMSTAKDHGYHGARFAWESAETGVDVTPTSVHGADGTIIPIRTGFLEEHIVADVAWATETYAAWSGDLDFLAGSGSELIVATARYWASRCRMDSDHTTHIYGVIGPDEYHEAVDDNAYTNVMARWNLRKAVEYATTFHLPVALDERERWATLAETMVDGFDPTTSLYEQFSGFYDLEPLIIADIAPRRPIAADLLLGRERVAQSQVIKQADVLMLHHLVPDQIDRSSLGANLDYYEPRTAHGSSLSPGIHAALLARNGRPDEALRSLDLVARIDLDDITSTSSGGLHLAAMGSLWQAVVCGFAGIECTAEGLHIDPHLPKRWTALEIPITWRGNRIRLHIEKKTIRIQTDAAFILKLPGKENITVRPEGVTLLKKGHRWEEQR